MNTLDRAAISGPQTENTFEASIYSITFASLHSSALHHRFTRPPFTITAEPSAYGILLENVDFVVLCICHSPEFENLVLCETFLISAQQPQLWHAHQEARLDEPRQAD